MLTAFNYILPSGALHTDSKLWALYSGPWQAAKPHPAHDQEAIEHHGSGLGESSEI